MNQNYNNPINNTPPTSKAHHFAKKDNVQILEEPGRNQPLLDNQLPASSLNPGPSGNVSLLTRPIQKSNSNVSISFNSNPGYPKATPFPTFATAPSEVSYQSRNSLSEPEVAQLFENPIFYENLLKHNKTLINDIKAQVRREVFEESKGFLEGLIRNQFNSSLKTELIDFKVQLSGFLPELVKSQIPPPQPNNEETLNLYIGEVLALKQKIALLESSIKAAPPQPQPDKKSPSGVHSQEVLDSLALMRNSVEQLHQSNFGFQNKIDALEAFARNQAQTNAQLAQSKIISK